MVVFLFFNIFISFSLWKHFCWSDVLKTWSLQGTRKGLGSCNAVLPQPLRVKFSKVFFVVVPPSPNIMISVTSLPHISFPTSNVKNVITLHFHSQFFREFACMIDQHVVSSELAFVNEWMNEPINEYFYLSICICNCRAVLTGSWQVSHLINVSSIP